jgi:glycosyltransferase involved in cell wall biosynthesis
VTAGERETPMRLAMIGHKDFPSRSGGVEVVVFELSTRLAQRGHSVTVYNRGRRAGDNQGSVQGVAYVRTATSQRQSLNALLYSITATLQALPQKYDLIHYHALGPSVMLLLPHLRGIPTVATVHGLDWQRAKWNRLGAAYLKLGERIIARYADEVIVLSRDVQSYFWNTYGRSTNLIENAVTPIETAPCCEIRRQFGLEHHEYVLYLARIVPEKGLHHLIRAFRRCEGPYRLAVAGELPDNDYGREIRRLADGCDRIVFTGFVQGQVLQELYSNCALYVLPSHVEGMALTLLEAMSAGARCLTSDIPENTDVLGEFGTFFISGDEESLYQALSSLLSQPAENPRAEEQRQLIRRQYSYDTMVEKTLAVYEKARRRQHTRIKT